MSFSVIITRSVAIKCAIKTQLVVRGQCSYTWCAVKRLFSCEAPLFVWSAILLEYCKRTTFQNFPNFGFNDGSFQMSFGIGAFPFGFFAQTFNINNGRPPQRMFILLSSNTRWCTYYGVQVNNILCLTSRDFVFSFSRARIPTTCRRTILVLCILSSCICVHVLVVDCLTPVLCVRVGVWVLRAGMISIDFWHMS